MPSNVKAFLTLSYLSLVLGLVYTSLVFSKVAALTAQMRHGKAGGAGFVIAVLVITTVISGTLVSLAGFGARNWARWTLLVLFLLGSVFSIPRLFVAPARYPLEHYEQVVQTLLQAIALFLIFTGNAREWYRRESAGRAL